MTNPQCEKCDGTGWVCELHRTQPFLHEGCPGPGDPCECNPELSFGTIHNCDDGRMQ